ncbi:hypothetical protein BPOR_0766g00020 [Botrytis porri]|uniref:Uncharacterized protein n=1 Tax=Botrytis porri TaxID=87229 RepID=A0A4Z1KAS8_9HELO|nr:hypothetical protein BPOR_0766g00020 [Botrytis porri]
MSAQLEDNNQAIEVSQDNNFPEDPADTDAVWEEEEVAAATAAALAPEPQAENGQVNEEAENDGFPADFFEELDEAFEEEQRIVTASAAAAAASVKEVQKANARLAVNLGMRVSKYGFVRPKYTIAEMKARQLARQRKREQAEREEMEERERRTDFLRARGKSKDEAICLD